MKIGRYQVCKGCKKLCTRNFKIQDWPWWRWWMSMWSVEYSVRKITTEPIPLWGLRSHMLLKVSKSRKKNGLLDSSKKRTKLTILSTKGAQDRLWVWFIFWKNPGHYILLSRFTDLYSLPNGVKIKCQPGCIKETFTGTVLIILLRCSKLGTLLWISQATSWANSKHESIFEHLKRIKTSSFL